jgi:peptide-methionine (S)-S-oxide reductase
MDTGSVVHVRLVRVLAALAIGGAVLAPAALATAPSAGGGPARGGAKDPPAASAVAVFAGGCFWCMEPPYDALPGVISTTAGYIGGRTAHPTYEQVSSGRSGHVEAIQVRYDPTRVSYDTLLEVFWRNIDPVAVNRQFCDVGPQYRSAIFYGSAREKTLAEASRRALAASGRLDRPIATEVLPATAFHAAEDYHQDYYVRNPRRYRFYRWNCGRDQRLRELWGGTT